MRFLLLLAMVPAITFAQGSPRRPLAVTANCESCPTWNTPREPVRLHGNTWYVGTRGLTALLITSPAGHVLFDGGLEESAPLIAASIRSLGFRLEDVKLILNSHVHYDHAGGLSVLQRATGARVAALSEAAAVLRTGRIARDDPQYGLAFRLSPVARVQVIHPRDTLQVGNITVTAHRTAGHAPGGTTWTWSSCDSMACRDIVYADSQGPVSADSFRFTGSSAAPAFQEGFVTLERLSCDILVAPHPEAVQLWERVAAREAGNPNALVDREACKRFAAGGRERLKTRLATEAKR